MEQKAINIQRRALNLIQEVWTAKYKEIREDSKLLHGTVEYVCKAEVIQILVASYTNIYQWSGNKPELQQQNASDSS